MAMFTGLSKRGRLDEAIADAIEIAKRTIPSDYVEWKLCEVSGKNGGFVLAQEITVTIEVSIP
jgi:hypothetical protein